MADFVRKLPAMKKKLHPVEFAARVHKDFVFIHPLWTATAGWPGY